MNIKPFLILSGRMPKINFGSQIYTDVLSPKGGTNVFNISYFYHVCRELKTGLIVSNKVRRVSGVSSFTISTVILYRYFTSS